MHVEISVVHSNKDNGLDTLVQKLGTLYVKDEEASAHVIYEKFESFKCPSDINIIGYLNEFETLYHEIQRYQMNFICCIRIWSLKKLKLIK